MTRVTIEENNDVGEETQAGFYIDKDGDIWVADGCGGCVLIEMSGGEVDAVDSNCTDADMEEHNVRRFRGTITVGD